MLRTCLLAFLLAACTRPPDFKAYCEKVAPCEGKSVEWCISDSSRLWREQKERGCGDEGADLVACKIQHGRCEKAGTWSLFMPTDTCKPALDRFAECLRDNK